MMDDYWKRKWESAQPLLSRAEEIARAAHEHQKYGVFDYMYHVYGVASPFMHTKQPPEIAMVALLHDVLEDSPITGRELRKLGMPENVILAVEKLTHPRGQDYIEYIKTLTRDHERSTMFARVVKIADIKFNLRHSPKPNKVPKYHYALELLQDAQKEGFYK